MFLKVGHSLWVREWTDNSRNICISFGKWIFLLPALWHKVVFIILCIFSTYVINQNNTQFYCYNFLCCVCIMNYLSLPFCSVLCPLMFHWTLLFIFSCPSFISSCYRHLYIDNSQIYVFSLGLWACILKSLMYWWTWNTPHSQIENVYNTTHFLTFPKPNKPLLLLPWWMTCLSF